MDPDLPKLILWEWENDFGCWIPYEPAVGVYLEEKYADQSSTPLGHLVSLASAQENLARYEIEFRWVGDDDMIDDCLNDWFNDFTDG